MPASWADLACSVWRGKPGHNCLSSLCVFMCVYEKGGASRFVYLCIRSFIAGWLDMCVYSCICIVCVCVFSWKTGLILFLQWCKSSLLIGLLVAMLSILWLLNLRECRFYVCGVRACVTLLVTERCSFSCPSHHPLKLTPIDHRYALAPATAAAECVCVRVCVCLCATSNHGNLWEPNSVQMYGAPSDNTLPKSLHWMNKDTHKRISTHKHARTHTHTHTHTHTVLHFYLQQRKAPVFSMKERSLLFSLIIYS